MAANCDFIEQPSVTSEDGRLQPDMLVRLPSGREVVVDSKVPLDAYLSALEAERWGAWRRPSLGLER